jgi:hypothetical protein
VRPFLATRTKRTCKLALVYPVAQTDTYLSTLSNQLTSPLLRFPAELRNKIYTFVGHSSAIWFHVDHTGVFDGSYTGTLYFLVPCLLSTCKQIRKEATSLLWTSTILEITQDRWNSLSTSLKHINCTLVTSLRVPRELAQAVEYLYAHRAPLKSQYSHGTTWLDLQRVHVQGEAFREESVRAAFREWVGIESLAIEFEGTVKLPQTG